MMTLRAEISASRFASSAAGPTSIQALVVSCRRRGLAAYCGYQWSIDRRRMMLKRRFTYLDLGVSAGRAERMENGSWRERATAPNKRKSPRGTSVELTSS